MSWTTTGLGWGTTPFNRVLNATEFVGAWNERLTVLGEAAKSVPVAGDIAQTLTHAAGRMGWADLQKWIFDTLHYWVQSHDLDGTPRAADYYDGETTIPVWTTANLIKAVSGGGEYTGFRRVTTIPTDWTDWADPAYISPGGYAVAGDIIGPWIMYDIQTALNMLIWQLLDGDAISIVDPAYRQGQGVSEPNRAAAEAAAAAAWDADTWHESAAVAFNATATTQCEASNIWHSMCNRARKTQQVEVDDTVARTVEWYVMTQKTPGIYGGATLEYAVQGCDVIEDSYSHYQSQATAASSGATITSNAVGDVATAPTFSALALGVGEAVSSGFLSMATSYERSYVRWNVVDGFTYV